jgi:hypothetical protein
MIIYKDKVNKVLMMVLKNATLREFLRRSKIELRSRKSQEFLKIVNLSKKVLRI